MFTAAMIPFALLSLLDVQATAPAEPRRLKEGVSANPLAFVPNRGQFQSDVLFSAYRSDSGFSITKRGLKLRVGESISYPLRGRRFGADMSAAQTVTIDFVGGRLDWVSPEDQLPGYVNFYLGNDPTRWQHRLPRYGRVFVKGVYPEIDLVVYGNGANAEYDFIVGPGADPNRIALEIGGGQVSLGANGDLKFQVGTRVIHQGAPVIYQVGQGDRKAAISGKYILRGNGTIGFQIGNYDRRRPLVIDPVIIYELSGETGTAISADHDGNAYIAWGTGLVSDVGVSKLSPTGVLVFETVVGGDYNDRPYGLALDAAANMVVVGNTVSANYPAQPQGVYDDTYNGGVDAFVTKFDATGAIVFSTFLGATGSDQGYAVAVDSDGNLNIGGGTSSADFPTTATGYQRFKTTGPLWFNGFIAVLDSTGSALTYSTFFGGTIGNIWDYVDDQINALTYDPVSRDLFLTGITDSLDFPITPGALRPQNTGADNYDCFVTRFRPTAAGADGLVYSTFLGGAGHEDCDDIAVDGQGSAYVAASEAGGDFFPPNSPPIFGSGSAVVAKISSTGSEIVYGHRLSDGGPGINAYGIAVVDRKAHVAGETGHSPAHLYIKVLSADGATITDYYEASGAGYHSARAIALDAGRNVYATGTDTVKVLFSDPSPIRITSTTPRWMPRRDPIPVTIAFEGPENIDTSVFASIDIIGPTLVQSVPNLAITRTSSSPPFTYQVTWNGPWSPGGNLLPAGNYSLEVLATTGTAPNQVQVRSQTYDAVGLVEVTSLRLEAAGGAEVDDNPSPSGGMRIFAEAHSLPTGWIPEPAADDKVQIQVQTEPAIFDPGASGPVVVFLRAFDVDDPAGPPVDPEAGNCLPSGCDNDTGPGNPIPQTGYLSSDGSGWAYGYAGVSVEVQGRTATGVFRTSIRQGDNYRVAASTSEDWLDSISVVSPSPNGSLTDPQGVLTEGAQVTEMLTVWRTLFVETYRFETSQPTEVQQAMELADTYDLIDPATRLRDFSSPLWTHSHGAGHWQDDGWLGANLILAFHNHGGQECRHNVVSNEISLLDTTDDLLAGQTPSRNRNYIVRDDYVTALGGLPDYSLADLLFAKAQIRVLQDPLLPLGSEPFVVNKHRNIYVIDSTVPAEVRSANTRWSVSFTTGFEGNENEDMDPYIHDEQASPLYELPLAGEADDNDDFIIGYKMKAILYQETIRDLYEKPDLIPRIKLPTGVWVDLDLPAEAEFSRRTVAHELLHTAGLSHDHAIMCYFNMWQDVPAGAALDDAQVARLRFLEVPYKNEEPDSCVP